MGSLLNFAMHLLCCIPALFRGQALVELALRQRLATYTQRGPKPRVTPVDRAFWIFLSQIWSGWREALVIVQPETVVRWHRKAYASTGAPYPGAGRGGLGSHWSCRN